MCKLRIKLKLAYLKILLLGSKSGLTHVQGRDLDAARAAAFAKRLAGAALLSETPAACGLLAVLERLIRQVLCGLRLPP
jgi:hypothetical protein